MKSCTSDERLYLAGSDALRAEDVMSCFENPEIEAIFCLRSGYGSARIADLMDYDSIARNPKPFIGSSDITFLHHAIYTKAGIPTVHAPMPSCGYRSHEDGLTPESLRSALRYYRFIPTRSCKKNPCVFSDDKPVDQLANQRNRSRILPQNILEIEINSIHNGKVSADSCVRLISGTGCGITMPANLTVLCTLAGTAYRPDMKGAVLFLEDINEPLYKIDRMMTHIKMAGMLDGISGLVFGYFTDTAHNDSEAEILKTIMTEAGEYADCPVICGFPFGHEFPSVALIPGSITYIDNKNISVNL